MWFHDCDIAYNQLKLEHNALSLYNNNITYLYIGRKVSIGTVKKGWKEKYILIIDSSYTSSDTCSNTRYALSKDPCIVLLSIPDLPQMMQIYNR